MLCGGFGRAKAAVGALALSLVLSGCTIPFVNIEIPFDLPNIPIPSNFDPAEMGIKPITLPIGVTTSVEEARQSVLSGKAATLSEGSLVMPGYLTVGVKTTMSSAPMCVLGEGGALYGLDADLGAALASEMGFKVRYVPVTDGSALGQQCDIIMDGRSNNPDTITIAGSYLESATAFFHRGDPVVVPATELGGKTVGLQAGSVSENVLNGTGLKMNQKPYANLNDAFNGLQMGEVDYVLCEAYPGAYLATLHDGVSFAGTLEYPETAGVAVLTANPELTTQVKAAFDAIAANGILEGVRSRWVGNMPVLTTDSVIQNIPEGNGQTSQTSPSQDSEIVSDGSGAGSNAVTVV